MENNPYQVPSNQHSHSETNQISFQSPQIVTQPQYPSYNNQPSLSGGVSPNLPKTNEHSQTEHLVDVDAERSNTSNKRPPQDELAPITGIKRIKLVMPPPPSKDRAIIDSFETPAMRLKNRPKRAKAFQSGLLEHSDSDDEDYNNSKSHFLSNRKGNSKAKALASPGSQILELPKEKFLPSNSYTYLACTSWPKRTNFENINEDGSPMSASDEQPEEMAQMEDEQYHHLDYQSIQNNQNNQHNNQHDDYSNGSSSSNNHHNSHNHTNNNQNIVNGTGDRIDRPQHHHNHHNHNNHNNFSSYINQNSSHHLNSHHKPVAPIDANSNENHPSTSSESNHTEKMILSVPEYDALLDSMNDEDALKDLNYPGELPISGLDSWRSTLDRKMIREGLDLNAPPMANWEDEKWEKGTYINCDLRYYDLGSLGKFDVVLVDPPWRIRGGQTTSDEKTMFNNNKFTLQYNTMSNEEIMDLDVAQLSDRGFIFLWTINSQIQAAFECLNKWGYTFVDRITWVKKTIKNNIFIGQGYYFLHSSEICLIGAKKDSSGNYLELVPKVSNDLIFAVTQKKSQKPEQLYHIIERMFPGAKKVELFARNHNIRPGWLSLGNQLGFHYNWSHDDIKCDNCHLTIPLGNPRFKHRTQANRDLCKKCLNSLKEDPANYFLLHNQFDEMCFHEYYECNGCNTHPLWGIRFTCDQCTDFDLCETCHDNRVVPEELKNTHLTTHTFSAIEAPELAGGLPVHRIRCLGCNTYPIIGYRFRCVTCTSESTNLCQKCFFAKKEPRNHSHLHEFQLIVESQLAHLQVKCDICRAKPILGPRFKCQQCFNFDICQECHDAKIPPPTNYASHKPTHTYIKISGDVDLTSDLFS